MAGSAGQFVVHCLFVCFFFAHWSKIIVDLPDFCRFLLSSTLGTSTATSPPLQPHSPNRSSPGERAVGAGRVGVGWFNCGDRTESVGARPASAVSPWVEPPRGSTLPLVALRSVKWRTATAGRRRPLIGQSHPAFKCCPARVCLCVCVCVCVCVWVGVCGTRKRRHEEPHPENIP